MKIGRRFAICVISILLIIGTIAAYVFYSARLSQQAHDFDIYGNMAGGVIKESLFTYMRRRDMPGLARKMEAVQKRVGNIRGIMLLNREGVAKVGTDKEPIGRKFSVHDPGCRECHEQGHTGSLMLNENTYRWASPVRNRTECHACHIAASKNNGVLIIDFSTAEFKRSARRDILTAYAIFGLSLLAIGVVMVFLTKVLVTGRLERIGSQMRDFQRGGPSMPVSVEGRDEITQLEAGFNEMTQAITARDREKDALVRTVNEQLRFLQLLIDAIPMPVFYKDINGVYQGYNRAFEELLGLPKDKLIGKTVYDVAPRELADKYYEMDKELFDHPGIQTYEYAVKGADSTIHEVIFNKATYTDAEGKVAGLVGAMPDITERKRMEDALRQTNETLQAVISASPLAVVSFDMNGNVGMWNKAAEHIFGWSAEETLGRYNPLVSDENKEEFMGLLRRVLEGESLVGVELKRRRKDGVLIDVSVSSAPLRRAKNEIVGMLSVISDITERKRIENALRIREAQLAESQRIAHIGSWERDLLTSQVTWSNELFRIFGYEPGEIEMSLDSLLNIMHADDRERFQQMVRVSIAEKRHHVVDYRVTRKDGTVVSVHAIGEVVCDDSGNPVLFRGTAQDVTERKTMEEAIRESEDRYRTLAETARDAIFIVNRRGIMEYINQYAAEQLGHRPDEIIGKPRTDLFPQEMAGHQERNLRAVFESGEPIQIEEQILLGGREAWLSTQVVPFRKTKGTVDAILGIARDITDRKKAEQVIQRNYDAQTAINWILHISLQDLPLDGILKQALDLILSISWLSLESRGSIFLVGEEPDKLVMKVQRGLSDSVNEECRIVPFGKCLCGRAAARGEVQFAEALDDRHEIRYEGISAHGHYCVPIMYAKKVMGVINLYLREGHQRDQKEVDFLNAIADALAGILQRKHVEEEREKLISDLRYAFDTISRSHKEWQDTFDSITDMIAIVDKDFIILKTNTAFSTYYGFDPRDVVGKKCHEIVHDGDVFPSCPHVTTVTEVTPSGAEYFDQRTKKLLRVVTFPYKSPEGEVIGSIHIMRDITDEKEKEARLIMSERLATLGQMASGIAHEINNPLASIAGCSEGLLARVKKRQFDIALFESYLGIIQEEVFRCKSITTAMLSFVRKTTYEKKDIDLTEALDKTIEIIGFQGRLKNVEIVRHYFEPSPVIHGNEGELRQVILIVVTNALDSMQDKGVLTIETDSRDGRAIFRITDSGEGIPPEIMERIFDPFFTTKSEHGGTGLGLSIARKIVGNHSGDIAAVSTPGKGTTITISFPL